jgi:hypothetical protein
MKLKISKERLLQIITEEYKDLHKSGLLGAKREEGYEFDRAHLKEMLKSLDLPTTRK